MTPNYKKRDPILIAAVLLIACALLVYTRLIHSRPAAAIEISLDGTVTQTLDLFQDQDLIIESPTGGTNHLIVEDGEAWITDATCPDKLCMHQGKISHDGEMLVCLPNRLIVKVVAD